VTGTGHVASYMPSGAFNPVECLVCILSLSRWTTSFRLSESVYHRPRVQEWLEGDPGETIVFINASILVGEQEVSRVWVTIDFLKATMLAGNFVRAETAFAAFLTLMWT